MKSKCNKLMKQIVAVMLTLCMVLGVVPSGLQVVKPVEVEAAYEPNWNHAGYNKPTNPLSLGECTAYVWGRTYEKLGIKLSGSISDWKSGRQVGQEPRANSIMVWSSSYNSYQGPGQHVAFVEAVEGNNVTISEANWSGKGASGSWKYICHSTTKSEAPTKWRSWNGGRNADFQYYIYLGNCETSSQF